MMMRTTTLTLSIVIALLLAVFILGRSTKNCPTLLDGGGVDSLERVIATYSMEAEAQQARIDTLRAMIGRVAPIDVKADVTHAYRDLAVPVDSLASILLAEPADTP